MERQAGLFKSQTYRNTRYTRYTPQNPDWKVNEANWTDVSFRVAAKWPWKLVKGNVREIMEAEDRIDLELSVDDFYKACKEYGRACQKVLNENLPAQSLKGKQP